MVGASLMGFQPAEISTFEWAWRIEMRPSRLEEIEVRGKRIQAAQRLFKRPFVVPYGEISPWSGPVC